LKIISWNLLYRRGATAADVAKLIEVEKPDLFLLQEAVNGINKLPGGELLYSALEGENLCPGGVAGQG